MPKTNAVISAASLDLDMASMFAQLEAFLGGMSEDGGLEFFIDEPEPELPTKSIQPIQEGIKQCKLCGNVENLIRTPCCNNWICDDADSYVMFSYAHNSCYRNHDRYTLCSLHFHEGHSGRWQDCQTCFETVNTEMYVYYGTNAYNFERLENPPSYEPTHCATCHRIIRLAEEGYSLTPQGYTCIDCSNVPF